MLKTNPIVPEMSSPPQRGAAVSAKPSINQTGMIRPDHSNIARAHGDAFVRAEGRQREATTQLPTRNHPLIMDGNDVRITHNALPTDVAEKAIAEGSLHYVDAGLEQVSRILLFPMRLVAATFVPSPPWGLYGCAVGCKTAVQRFTSRKVDKKAILDRTCRTVRHKKLPPSEIKDFCVSYIVQPQSGKGATLESICSYRLKQCGPNRFMPKWSFCDPDRKLNVEEHCVHRDRFYPWDYDPIHITSERICSFLDDYPRFGTSLKITGTTATRWKRLSLSRLDHRVKRELECRGLKPVLYGTRIHYNVDYTGEPCEWDGDGPDCSNVPKDQVREPILGEVSYTEFDLFVWDPLTGIWYRAKYAHPTDKADQLRYGDWFFEIVDGDRKILGHRLKY
jgi:hypothetical protein